MHFLGIDYGEKRIGLSYADELKIAIPLSPATGRTLKERLEKLAQTIKERKIDVLVIGYPYNMDGSIGFKAKEVDLFIKKLEKQFKLPIFKIDERLSSQQVESDILTLKLQTKKQSIKSKQTTRKTGELDSRVAALLLQDFLETQDTQDNL